MAVLSLLKRIRSHKHLYCQHLAKEPDVLTGLLNPTHINFHIEDNQFRLCPIFYIANIVPGDGWFFKYVTYWRRHFALCFHLGSYDSISYFEYLLLKP